jgi:DNA ligase (NAD+)
LGIKLVGIGSAKRLCRNIPLKELPNKTVEELLKVPDIGEDTANSIYQYFRENGNDRVFNYYFWALGAEFESTYQPEATGKFSGKVFAFSGSFKSPSREELKTMVEQHGGTVGGSPGKSTSYFVVGESPTTHKVEKAKSLSIPVIAVQEFLGMI